MGLALGLVGAVATSAPAQSDDALAAAAADVIGFVPQDVRYQCTIDPTPQKQKFGSAAASVRVGLLCPGSEGVDFVEYFLFSSNEAMNGADAQAVSAHTARTGLVSPPLAQPDWSSRYAEGMERHRIRIAYCVP